MMPELELRQWERVWGQWGNHYTDSYVLKFLKTTLGDRHYHCHFRDKNIRVTRPRSWDLLHGQDVNLGLFGLRAPAVPSTPHVDALTWVVSDCTWV